MSDELIPISCDKCQARFRIKPTAFKIMKTLRCTKCGNGIVLAKFADALKNQPPAAAATAPAPAAPPSSEKAAPVEAPAAAAPAEAPAPPAPPAVEPKPEPPKPAAAPPPPPPPAIDPTIALKEEVRTLQTRITTLEADLQKAESALKKAEADRAESDARFAELQKASADLKKIQTELAESDARVADLQQLWHSKELEAREMADRMNKAEKNAREAMAARDAFLARIKDELALHLVRERDASLTRFAELEKKLLSMNPEAP